MSVHEWRDDLGTLLGLGYNRAVQLAMVGIQTSADLLAAGTEDMLDRINGKRWSFGRYQIGGWVAHARAWATNEPVIFGNPPPMPVDYTTFDLEYLRQGEIWLAGICRPAVSSRRSGRGPQSKRPTSCRLSPTTGRHGRRADGDLVGKGRRHPRASARLRAHRRSLRPEQHPPLRSLPLGDGTPAAAHPRTVA